ncbi:hypothetical protein K501DRAFT_283216 [Backusella circina FSU 941]|nr:hypothetical protein K501DRAFT_283216 [Backusella circina FSU 941]
MNQNNIELFSRLSFEKLEAFDMHRSSLSSFVLVRNALITVLTEQEDILIMSEQNHLPEQEEEEKEEVQEVWLDSCFNELDDEDDNSSDSEEDDMPSSPQDIRPFFKKASFYINDDEEDEEDLICYDIPFLSLDSTF